MTVIERRKRVFIMGLANKDSIAKGVYDAYRQAGAEIVVGTVPFLLDRARTAVGDDSVPLLGCDVSGSDDDIVRLADELKSIWPDGFDYFVHAVANSDKNELKESIFNTSRENYLKTQDISAYSLLAMCRELGPMICDGGGVATYTFAASRFRSPNYNTMAPAKAALETLVKYIAFDEMFARRKVKVIAISAGPIKTLSSMGVGGFRRSLAMGALRSATGDNVTQEDVGEATVHLLATPGLTGVTIDIDNGISVIGVGASDDEYAYHGEHGAFTRKEPAAAE